MTPEPSPAGPRMATPTPHPYLGVFWMQRRARLKAMFRHSSSEEAMSLCRSFCKEPHGR